MELYTVEVHYNAPNSSYDSTGELVCTGESLFVIYTLLISLKQFLNIKSVVVLIQLCTKVILVFNVINLFKNLIGVSDES